MQRQAMESNRRNAYRVDGNTVRRMEAAPDYRQERIRREEKKQEEEQRQKQRQEQMERTKKKLVQARWKIHRKRKRSI